MTTPEPPYGAQPPSAPAAPGYGPGAYSSGPFAPQASDASTPLDQPYYGISFWPGYTRFWRKYATFSGRASKSEFWWAYLGNGIIGAVLGVLYIIGVAVAAGSASVDDSGSLNAGTGAGIGFLIFAGILWAVFGLAVIVPTFAILWRRLHDANLVGPLALLTLVPSVGGLWGLAIGFLPTSPAGARFDLGGASYLPPTPLPPLPGN